MSNEKFHDDRDNSEAPTDPELKALYEAAMQEDEVFRQRIISSLRQLPPNVQAKLKPSTQKMLRESTLSNRAREAIFEDMDAILQQRQQQANTAKAQAASSKKTDISWWKRLLGLDASKPTLAVRSGLALAGLVAVSMTLFILFSPGTPDMPGSRGGPATADDGGQTPATDITTQRDEVISLLCVNKVDEARQKLRALDNSQAAQEVKPDAIPTATKQDYAQWRDAIIQLLADDPGNVATALDELDKLADLLTSSEQRKLPPSILPACESVTTATP